MNSIEIDTKSWLFRFIRTFSDLSISDIERGNVDSCKFIRLFLQSIILFLLLCATASIFVYFISDMIALLLVDFLFKNFFFFPGAGIVFIFISGLFSIIFVLVLIGQKLFKNFKAAPEHIELYNSFKDKFCKEIVLKKERK